MKLAAAAVRVGVPAVESPYQKVADEALAAMLIDVTVLVLNCWPVPTENFPPADEDVRFTVKAVVAVSGVPLPFWRCTVINPRLGVADVEPLTAALVMTSFDVLIVVGVPCTRALSGPDQVR